jgi:hypothetical protein
MEVKRCEQADDGARHTCTDSDDGVLFSKFRIAMAIETSANPLGVSSPEPRPKLID